MRRILVLALALVLMLGACSEDGDAGAGAEPSPSVSFPFATVLLDNGERSTLITVEVAETPEQQESGLSHRDSLADDEGMVFVFFEERDSGLRTTGATIPLSIAFFDAQGTVVRILDADPCTEGPCPVHEPDEPYMGVLFVNRGAFDEWDISEGDHLQLTR